MDDLSIKTILIESKKFSECFNSVLEYVKQIGQGVAGDVFLGYERSTNRMYAVKRLSLVQGDKAAVNELIIHFLLSRTKKSQVTPMLGWKEHPNGYIDLVMKYFPNRDLFYHIESFGEQSEKSATTAAFF